MRLSFEITLIGRCREQRDNFLCYVERAALSSCDREKRCAKERERKRDGSGAAVVVRCCEGKGWSERWRSRDWKETDGGGRSGGGKGRARSHWVVVKWCPSLR